MKINTLLNTSAIIGMLLACVLTSQKASAQAFCANEVVYWSEDFGTGTTPTSHPNVLNSLVYQPTGPLENEGVYRVVRNTHQKPEWHTSPDHTPGDVNGKMLVVNGLAETFFRKGVTNPNGYPAGFYSVSVFMMNVNTPGTCAPTPILPNLTINMEYRDANNDWIGMGNSPVTTVTIAQSATPTWVQLGAVFTLPATGTFVVNRIRFYLTDNPAAGCGNDFALDDLKFASCPAGGPLPVQFLNISAVKKGSGVQINWATASEFNNRYFDIEKSTDGGYNWITVSTTESKGNGNILKNYSAYDAKPTPGANFYRIKQVDVDGTAKYSATVVYKLIITNTDVSVIANPFFNQIDVRFLSDHSQVLSVRLFDNLGKQVYSSPMNISKGASDKMIPGTNLQKGLYILNITNDMGEIIYSDKLIKQ
ncbi:MAG: T9SS type A sorting domain-containing protein [Ferruginibacter sp.]